jgi:hypothetical protein
MVALIATEVVTVAYPDELYLLPELLATTDTSPRRLRAPVGMGVDLAAAAPVLLSALSYVATATAGHLVDDALTKLGSAAYRKLSKVFRRGDGASGDPDPEAAWPEVTALFVTLLIERGMRPELAAETAVQIVAAMRRRA